MLSAPHDIHAHASPHGSAHDPAFDVKPFKDEKAVRLRQPMMLLVLVFCCLKNIITIIAFEGWNGREAESNSDEVAAIQELQRRGVHNAARELEHASPQAIITACREWDKRTNVTVGLLVSWIRQGGIEPAPSTVDKAAVLRKRFDELTGSFPEGAVTEPHSRMQARQWPHDEPCPGRLVVFDRSYPTLMVACDECGFEASYPLRALAGLRQPADSTDRVGLADGSGSPLLGGAA